MKLIVGLGNPGAKYRDNRHNIGFITVDEWAYQQKIEFNKRLFDAEFVEHHFAGEKVIVMKPQTYMNLSGQAIRPLMNYFNIPLEDLIVIYDDMDLPVGKIRLRQQGSAGGHNGIKSIIECLETQKFNRIKVGVGRPAPGVPVVSHVLTGFPKHEHEDILSAVKQSTLALEHWITHKDFIQTMNVFN